MHITVLKNETINKISIDPNANYIDCTLGHGGHTLSLLEKLNNKGFVTSIDQDTEAIKVAKEKLNKTDYINFNIVNNNFKNINTIIKDNKLNNIKGIIYDLGVNSNQFDIDNRGFSYKTDKELDMRMDSKSDLTAKKILNTYSEDMLNKIFKEYGEIKDSKKIAKAIINKRNIIPINKTFELNNTIDNLNINSQKILKQVYQSLRIEVNDEFESLKKSLEQAIDSIAVDGVVCVITFHSLEDKITKDIFYKYKSIFFDNGKEIKHKFKTTKTIYPSAKEVESNRRSRTAKLRVIKRIY